MPGLSQIKRPQKGEDVCELWKIVDANVVFANAIISNFTVVQGNDASGSLQISEGNAVLTLPKGTSGGGGSGGGLGPVLFNGAANGQPCLFLINSDGVAYGSPPTKPDGSAYPVANPD